MYYMFLGIPYRELVGYTQRWTWTTIEELNREVSTKDLPVYMRSAARSLQFNPGDVVIITFIDTGVAEYLKIEILK